MTVRETRWEVYSRDDGRCVAQLIDPFAGPCYDQWGNHIATTVVAFDDGEMDYVRLGAHGARHELAIDHIWLCPGHHRGTGPSAGYQWATAHRADARAYLDSHLGIAEYARLIRRKLADIAAAAVKR